MINILDFIEYCESFLVITTKDGKLVKFKLKPFQKKIILIILDLLNRGLPVRVIILKPRQMGISTLVAAFIFWLLMTRANTKAILIADQFKRTKEVFSIYSRYYHSLPKKIQPLISIDTTTEMYYQNPKTQARADKPGLQTGIRGESAQDKNAGRGGTTRLNHISEHAYFPDAGKIDEGLGNSVAYLPGSVIIKESTGNGTSGPGEAYYNVWRSAESGDNNYTPIFIAWFENDDYELKAPIDFKPDKTEIELLETFPEINYDKLNWRRMKLREYKDDPNSAHSPERRFNQDYPETPDVAFLSSGAAVFDHDKLNKQIEFLRKNPPMKMDVQFLFKGTVLEEYAYGLEFYDLPEKGKAYVVSGDVAEGLESGDASHAFVMDNQLNQVARWHGKVDPDIFGLIMIGLGYFYDALLAPEVNNMGSTTLNTIKKTYYPLVFIREVKDKITDEITKKLGWLTTVKNKLPMINEFQSVHRDDEIKIRDIHLLREMKTVTREPDGKVFINGKDRVAAACIAMQAVTQVAVEDEANFVEGGGSENYD